MFIMIRLLCLLIGLNNPTTYDPMQILALKKSKKGLKIMQNPTTKKQDY